MAQFFQIHPENPQHRLIVQAADIIRKGGIVVYPTDSAYALGCHIGDKDALDRIRAKYLSDQRPGLCPRSAVDGHAGRIGDAGRPGPSAAQA